MRSTRRLSVWLVVVALSASTLWTGGGVASAVPSKPRLKLVRSNRKVVQHVREGKTFRLDPGVYLASLDAPFEVAVERAGYEASVEASQHLQGGGVVPLPASVLGPDPFGGLRRFFSMKVVNATGDVVVDRLLPLCPNTWDPQRVDDSGPVQPTYPDFCYSHPFMLGMVWGIDQGWSVSAISPWSSTVRLPPGRYEVEVSIAPTYIGLFDVAPGDASTAVTLVVKRHKKGHGGPIVIDAASRSHDARARRARVPDDPNPDPSTLPDLIPLPSFGIGLRNRGKREILSFGANVWVSGAAPLVVEGFRRDGASLMDAYQYFYDGDEQVGRAEVGTFEYDKRHGHTHWHFRQFARYALLAADRSTEVVSQKEAFCLAPTDPIDLTLPGAALRPWPLGLETACGGPRAMWIREVLPLGWGDTYYQGLPGQAFDVTGLPNGTYYIKVQANPGARLFEQRRGNNVRLREIRLRGRPGKRRVIVPPWHGIDTHGAQVPAA